jgi:ribosomal protein L32
MRRMPIKMPVNFIEKANFPLPQKSDDNTLYHHICEVCGIREILTAEEGFQKGWDYSPRMYPFKVISPRTCPNCGIDKTVWADISLRHKTFEELSKEQKEMVKRIYGEPESIIVK